MIVYIVTGHYSWEGFTICGVFTDREAATELAENPPQNYDWVCLEEWPTDGGDAIKTKTVEVYTP